MATNTTALASFTGTSKFAESLQQSLVRAVGIAALPLNSLSARQTTLNDRQSALQALDTRFASLQSSLAGIERALKSGALSASVSNGAIVNPTVTPGALAGTYSLEVEDLGSFSSALSTAGATVVADPTSHGLTTATSFTLTAGGNTKAITAASSSLQDVVAAINLQAGEDVQASLVNVGGSSAPDYRLSLRATKLGSSAIALTDNLANNLIGSSSAGTLASYKVEGSSSITSNSRTVTLAPNVSVTLLSENDPGETVTVSVRTEAAGLASSFNSFAQSYNSAVDAINQNRGENGGALQGDSLLRTLTGILSQLGNFSEGTPETALANFGITLDKSGHLSVETATLTSKANANFSAFTSLVGKTDGGGFLKLASDLLKSVEDASSGYIKSAESSLQTQKSSLQNRIDDQQARLVQLQQNLILQLAKADSAIAHLESQVSYVNGLFYSITGNNNGNGKP